MKMTYEFNTLTVNELVEIINYDITITVLGNISVTFPPQLTVFESTGKLCSGIMRFSTS